MCVCVCVCVCACMRACVCACALVQVWVCAFGCCFVSANGLLVDVCQCCCLLMFVCLPLSRYFPCCKTWWIKNLNLNLKGQSHETVFTDHTIFEEKGEPKRIRTEVPLLTSLTPHRLAKAAHKWWRQLIPQSVSPPRPCSGPSRRH